MAGYVCERMRDVTTHSLSHRELLDSSFWPWLPWRLVLQQNQGMNCQEYEETESKIVWSPGGGGVILCTLYVCMYVYRPQSSSC